MPRTLPTGVQTVATSAGYVGFYAVEVLLGTPVRITDAPTGCTVNANTFVYGFLAIGDSTYNEHPALSIQLAATDNVLLTADLANLAHGALDYVTVNVWEVHLNAAGAQLNPVTILSNAVIVGYTADEASIQLTVQGVTEISAGMVGRVCSRNCMYVFKGLRCGYAGGNTSCNHTLAGCTANSNTGRFGGYQTMPTLNTRLSYWVTSYVPASYRYGTTVPQAAATPPTTPVAPRIRTHLTGGSPLPLTPVGPRGASVGPGGPDNGRNPNT